MTGWPPDEPPEPSEIMLTPALLSSGKIARVIPVSSRCEKHTGGFTPSCFERREPIASEDSKSEAS